MDLTNFKFSTIGTKEEIHWNKCFTALTWIDIIGETVKSSKINLENKKEKTQLNFYRTLDNNGVIHMNVTFQ